MFIERLLCTTQFNELVGNESTTVENMLLFGSSVGEGIRESPRSRECAGGQCGRDQREAVAHAGFTFTLRAQGAIEEVRREQHSQVLPEDNVFTFGNGGTADAKAEGTMGGASAGPSPSSQTHPASATVFSLFPPALPSPT